MAVVAFKVIKGLGDALVEGEILHVEEADAQALVDGGYLEPATAEDVNGGEETETVDDVDAVSNAAKSLETKLHEAGVKMGQIIAEKMLKNSVPAPVIPAAVKSNDEKTWGFKSLGDFAKCAVAGQAGNITAARRIETAQKMATAGAARSKDAGYSTGGGPSITNSDGSVLIPPQYAQSLFEKVKGITNLYDHCTDYPFANTTEIPADNESGYNSGVKAYWQTEDSTVGQTKPVIGTAEIKAKNLMCLVPVTQQLLDDNAYVLDTWLGKKVPTKMVDQLNLNVLYGAGGGANVIGHTSTVVVTRQTSNRITFADISAMYSRLHTDNLDGAKWYLSPSYVAELLKLSFPDSTGSFPLFVPNVNGYPNVSGAIAGSLFGKPVVLTHAMQALGVKGVRDLLERGQVIVLDALEYKGANQRQ